MKRLAFFVFLAFSSSLNQCDCKKINYPRLLLPIFDDFSVNFTLEVIEKGCFSWKVNRPDLLRITPLYDDEASECSYRAIVSPVLNRDKSRNTPLVLAEEISSREVLRCDVILDVIHSFKVITTTRELFLQEAPEKFELMAHDVYGNAFSTLEDVEFQWEILQHSQSDQWTDVLRFLKFSESTYHEVPETMARLESLGVTGCMILLDGINTGTAKVSVRLPYNEYSRLSPVDVDIMVLANILIDPNDVHILVGDRTRFKVLQITQGTLSDISSNSQYYLEIEKSNVARMVNHVATGLELGKSLVMLRDKNVDSDQGPNGDSTCPKATLSVVEAAKLTVDLLPHHSWITVEGEYHDIVFTLVTKDDQRIILGDAYQIKSEINSDYYRVDEATKNGTHHYGAALKMGKSLVRGQFEGLSVEMELQILKRIQLTPRLVIIPFDPLHNGRPNRIQFQADGGDGNFIWSVDNKNLATINKNGLAEARLSEHTHDQQSRKASVKVALQRNPKISETASILFMEPVKLEIVEYNFETALNDLVVVNVALYAEDPSGPLVPFTDCRNINFELDFTERIFKTEAGNSTLVGNSCQVVLLKSINIGRTQLKVTYRYQDRILSDSVQLVVFEPLELLSPGSAELVLPVGSSQNVIFMNGPEKLFNIDAELTKQMVFTKSIIDVSEITTIPTPPSFNINAFTVLCKKVGETELNLKMSNSLATKKYRPYYFVHTNLKVFCVKPRFLNLISRSKLNDACPMNTKVNSIVEVNDKDNRNGAADQKDFVEVEIEVLDAYNRKLSNISSLELTWKLLEGANQIPEFHHQLSEELVYVESIAVPGAYLLNVDKNLKAEMKTNFKLVGTVVGYDADVLHSVKVVAEEPPFGIQKTARDVLQTPLIESELNFMVVNATLLASDRITIFYKSTRRVPILQGSGYYEIALSDRSKVTAEIDRQKNEILLRPKEIGSTIMTVYDRCVSSLKQEVTVSVVSVEKIELLVSDRVELSKSIDAIARLYWAQEVLDVDHNDLDPYELVPNVLNGDILTMTLAEDQNHLQRGEIRYRVNGRQVGDTKVSVTAGKTVQSTPTNTVQVFAPLELFPKNSTILIGTSIQIQYTGGPQPDVGVNFLAVDEKILNIESAVVHGARIGNSLVIGRCDGFDPSTGATMSFSQDSVVVHVVPLDGIKIVAPLVNMIEGAVMPASIWALPNIPPSILGTLTNLRVLWSTTRPDVLEISSIFSGIGVEYTDQDLINVRVRGLKPGKAQLNTKVISPNGKTFLSSLEINVVADLELERPKRMTAAGSVLAMPPNSEIQLKANIDDAQFKLNNPAALAGRNLINVTESGTVTSGDQIGFAVVMASSASSVEQELPIVVRVKNIHYIMATVHLTDNVNLRIGESKIPRGLTVQLKITLHDNMGNEILHNWDGGEHLRHAVARRDGLNVHIEADFKLTVALLHETSNILTVALRGLKSNVKYAEDYVKLSVAQSSNTFPTVKEILSTGDVVCFDSLLSSLSAVSSASPSVSKWMSGDPSAIKVNDKTGVAVVNVANGEQSKRVEVTHKGNSAAMKFDVDTRQADSVEFLRVAENFHGREAGGEHRAYAVIRNRLQGAKLTNLIARNVSRCVYRLADMVDPSQLFSCHIPKDSIGGAATDRLFNKIGIRPGFEAKRGQYYCGISLVDYDQEWIPALRKSSLNFIVEMRLKNGIMAATELKVISGVHVAVDRIKFTKETDTPEFTVIGRDAHLKGMRVEGSHKSLEVKKISTSATGEENEFAIRYQVKMIGSVDDADVLSVMVESPNTEQVLHLPVEWPNERMCSTRPFSGDNLFASVVSNLGLIISTVIVTFAFIYVLLWCSSSKAYTNPQAFQNGSPKGNSLNGSHNQSSFITQSHSIPSPTKSDAFNASSIFNQSASPLSPIYGDTGAPISPHRRMNTRFM